jgi:uncharacterized RDD family membrane protein YckC
MTSPSGAAAAKSAATTLPGPTPSLPRRMACFTYEATLLFGLGLIPGAVGALFVSRSGSPWQSETALRVFALLVYGLYFVWLWSKRGQTLAMQTWRIRVVTLAGVPPSKVRALARFVACCVFWFLPATIAARLLQLPPWPSLGVAAAGVVVYALLALAEPNRQFWHDRLCGTRLIDVGREPAAGVTPRPR